MNTTLSIVNLAVFRLRASKADDVETHVEWSATYSTTSVTGDAGDAWPVLATIHAGGVGGWADITVSGLLKNGDTIAVGDWESELASSEALETLYDFARSHLSPLLATIDADVPLPVLSPQVELAAFESDSDDEPDTQSTPSASNSIAE